MGIIWSIFGILTFLILTISHHYFKEDLTLGDLLIFLFMSLVGPVTFSIIVCILIASFITDIINYFTKYKNIVLIKGRK